MPEGEKSSSTMVRIIQSGSSSVKACRLAVLVLLLREDDDESRQLGAAAAIV